MFHGPGPGRPKGSITKQTLKQREFAEMILGKPGTIEFDEYIQTQRAQLLAGEMHPSIHNTLLHYAHGKPTERIEIKDTTNDMSQVSAEELRARALALASRIMVTDTPSQDDDVTVN